MRGPWLVAGLLVALTMSGCLVDSDGDGKMDGFTGGKSSDEVIAGTDAEGNTVLAGADLGALTFSESGNAGSVKVIEAGCETDFDGSYVTVNSGNQHHKWTIASSNDDGIPWAASTITFQLTEARRTSADVDLVVTDDDGNELGRSSEVGPDGANGPTALTIQNVAPDALHMYVINCSGAVLDYTLDGTADMVAVASGPGGPSSGSSGSQTSGDVTVTPKTDGNGNVYYEATRQETYRGTLTGATGTADISTGAGFIDYTGGGGDDHKLVATLKARGDSEQQAKQRLAEMSVDHTVKNAAAVILDVHGRPGGDGQWNHKQIDLVFDSPASIDWTTFSASSSAGYVHADTVTGTRVDLDTSAGYVQVDGVDADTLDAHTSAGYVQVRDTRAKDMILDTSAGAIDASMLASTQSGSWDLSASAGQVVLTVKETSNIGYDMDARTSAGQILFHFDDVQETQSDCQYASCHRQGRTTGYDSRSIKVGLDLSTSAGQITAGS